MNSVFRKLPDSDRNFKASLYIGNIDPNVTEPLLYELFVQFGPIRSLNLPKDRVLKIHQGYGFVEFKSVKDAEYVLTLLRGIRLYGRLLKLKKAEPNLKGLAQQQIGAQITSSEDIPKIDVGAKVFINNLNPLIDEPFLADTFSKFGTLIRYPLIARDSTTGKSKGHGFISFADFSESDEAIERMNGAILMNSKISVQYAFKDDPILGSMKRVRHGDTTERLLAQNARMNNILPMSSQSNQSRSVPKETKKMKR